MATLKLDSPIYAWVYLNRVLEGPSRSLHELLKTRCVEEIAEGVYEGADWLGRLRDETYARRDWLRQDEDLEAAERVGARLITADSPDWPKEEFDSAFGFYHSGQVEAPAAFDSLAVPPHSLWVRGGNLRTLATQAIAVIGTRAITRYGNEATRMMVGGLVKHQWTIVSGGALGVDTVAHEMALEAGGQTVAIAACGIDHPYPARNTRLFDRIAHNGCVITEFPPGATPQRHRFLTRNRLSAALTSGTLVMEAAFRSGALNTANWAEALGRVVMAVPGPITGTNSLGCHLRIQSGRAQLVTGVDDARSLLTKAGAVDPEGQYEIEFLKTPVQKLSRNELRVFDATPPVEAMMGASAEEIAREAGMRVPLVVHLLVALEKSSMVMRTGSLWQRVGEEG